MANEIYSKIVNTQLFYGGKSSDKKIGIPASFAHSQSIDFRKRPSEISVLPGTRKISAGNVTDLIQNIVQIPTGERYALGSGGGFYEIDNSNVIVKKADVSAGAYGLLYRQDTDDIYIAGTRTVSQYGQMTNANATPVASIDKYGVSKSTDDSAYATGGTATYTVPTSISETGTNECRFEPDIEPLYSVKLNVTAVGTGDWTFTLHDDADNTLAVETVTNANMTTGLYEVVWTTPVRMLVSPNARTYHVHATSTVADGTIRVATAGDMSTADFEMWADRLVNSTNGMHPIVQFLQYVLIGNERYLSVWEPLSDDPSNLEWNRHRLTFPPGYEVCSMTATDEFVVVGCEKRSSATREFQDGKLYIWDGLSETYNQIIDVPEGSPHSLYTHDNLPYFIVSGSLYVWAGGKETIKVRTFEHTDSEYTDAVDQTINYPNMLSTRRNILLVGYPSQTTNELLEHGVYSWGQIEKNYPQSWGYSYVMSTGTKLNNGTNNLRIGYVGNFGDELYISWRDGSSYGLDIVDNYSDPATTASWESLIFDGGAVYKEKMAGRIKVFFEDLPSDVSITIKYKLDRASSWSYGDAATSGTSTQFEFPTTRRFREIQYGFDVACTGTATPKITGITLEFNPLQQEDDLL
jgi:hypothetical protein